MDNPYLDEYSKLNPLKNNAFEVLSTSVWQRREELTRKYSWAIPNLEAIQCIAKYTPILEVGAGSGYWAKLISEYGAITALDTKEDNNYNKLDYYYYPIQKVNQKDLLSTVKSSKETLFLCWPPYKSSFAYDVLKAYQGDTFIYVGEDRYGCTANEKFHKLLENKYRMIETVEIPQWYGLHDNLSIWKNTLFQL